MTFFPLWGRPLAEGALTVEDFRPFGAMVREVLGASIE